MERRHCGDTCRQRIGQLRILEIDRTGVRDRDRIGERPVRLHRDCRRRLRDREIGQVVVDDAVHARELAHALPGYLGAANQPPINHRLPLCRGSS